MPNGGSWDRFWITIVGFRAKHGRWPTRVLWPVVVRDVVEGHLSAAELSRLREKLALLLADDLAAEDDLGGRYEYAGPTSGGYESERQEWFGVDWD